jgi:hypothetical protein
MVDISFYSGNVPDQSLANRIIPMLKEKDLVIRDLGFYALDSIKKIEQAGAYYISRFKSNIDVYESKDAKEPLDLAKFLDHHNCKGVVDIIVYIGKEKHPTRLIACKMSEEAINQRRKDANRNAQRHGRQTSKKKLSLLKYNIFITNVPMEMLSSTLVMAAYRARWRIELIFKQWKSCLKLHFFKGYKKERIYCFLYGRLAMVLLLGAMTPILMQYALELGRELSSYKLTYYLIADHAFAIALIEGTTDCFIKQLEQDIPRRLCMDKRRRPTLRDNVKNGQSYYNELNNNNIGKKVA